jgi:hypothetical protein
MLQHEGCSERNKHVTQINGVQLFGHPVIHLCLSAFEPFAGEVRTKTRIIASCGCDTPEMGPVSPTPGPWDAKVQCAKYTCFRRASRDPLFVRCGHRSEDNTKIDLQELGWGGMHQIYLTRVRDGWRAVVKAGCIKCGKFI